MQEISDFSSASRATRARRPWLLWVAVLVLHALALAAMDTALSVGRLAALEPSVLQAAIVQEVIKPAKIQAKAPPQPLPMPLPETVQALPIEPPPAAIDAQPLLASAASPLSAPEPLQQPPAAAAPPQPALTVPLRPAVLPNSTELRYKLIKGSDSAKASITWRVLPGGTYELVVEATYFGFSAFKQTSSGHVDSTGLLPLRYGDKRRGKSEQAAHFDHVKKVITYSNNRPEAALRTGSQDRASMLIQLGGLLAADAALYREGAVIHLPISNVDELEAWAFEVSASETLDLPIGQREAIKLTRRPRRAFDQTVELWLAPAEQYLPVRIRFTDSSGITDQQLTGRD